MTEMNKVKHLLTQSFGNSFESFLGVVPYQYCHTVYLAFNEFGAGVLVVIVTGRKQRQLPNLDLDRDWEF
jgi:hypothetical protein